MKHSSKLVARAAILSVTTLAAAGLQQTLVAAEETSLEHTSGAVLTPDSSSTPEATSPSSEVKETATEANSSEQPTNQEEQEKSQVPSTSTNTEVSEAKTTETSPTPSSEEAQTEAITPATTEVKTTDISNTYTPSQVEQERKKTALSFTDNAVKNKAIIQKLPYLTDEEKKQYQAEINQKLQEDLERLSKSSLHVTQYGTEWANITQNWMLNGEPINFTYGHEVLHSIYSSEKAKTYYEGEVANFETKAIEGIQKDTTLTEEQKEITISAVIESVKRQDFGFGSYFSDSYYKKQRQKFLTHLEKLGAPIAFYLRFGSSPINTRDIIATYSDESLAKISEEYTKIINDSVDEAIKIGRETLNLSDDQVAILEKEKKTAVFKRDTGQSVTYHRSAKEILDEFINSTQDISKKIKLNELKVKATIKDDTSLSDEQKTLALNNLDNLVELATIMEKNDQNSYYIYVNFFGGRLGKGVTGGSYDDIFNRAISYALINQDISTIIPSSSFSDSKTGVSVDGASYKLDKVDKIEVTAVTNGVFSSKTYNAYDIKLLDKDANYIQPSGDIEVSLPITREDVEAVYYVNDKNELEALPFTVKAGQVIFVTNHFSVYAVVFKGETNQDNTPATPDENGKTGPNHASADTNKNAAGSNTDTQGTNTGSKDLTSPDTSSAPSEVSKQGGQASSQTLPSTSPLSTANTTTIYRPQAAQYGNKPTNARPEVAATKQNQLPKTGDTSIGLSVLGALLSSFAVFGFKRKQKY